MKNIIAKTILANIEAGSAAPQRVLLFKAGWVEIEGEGKVLIDKTAFDLTSQEFARRNNDIVFDYEHQTLKDVKAPAAGWIKALEYDDGAGIFALVDWTEEAARFIVNKEYRYFSPVFMVRKSDSRLARIHSVALTNAPKTNNLTPILAKLGETIAKEENMEFFEKLFTKLDLKAGASEEDVFLAIEAAKKQQPREVIAKDVLTALSLKEGSDTSTVVASIHALKQESKGMVSRTEFDNLQKELRTRDANEVVVAALKEGKITPDQKDWANEYAARDLAGFKTFIAKAPVVVPISKLPGKEEKAALDITDEATLKIAKMFGNSPEDIKKYAGGEK
jgi:phage I-like protein